MDIAYDRHLGLPSPCWSALANTGEVLRIVNRPGQPPFARSVRADALRSELRRPVLPGWSRSCCVVIRITSPQTEHLTAGTRWSNPLHLRLLMPDEPDQPGRAFARKEPGSRCERRQPPPEPATQPRQRKPNVKDERVRTRAFGERSALRKVKRWRSLNHRPGGLLAKNTVVVVVRKNISRGEGRAVSPSMRSATFFLYYK